VAKPPISKLPKEKRRALLDDLNYLNTAEIKAFCTRHSIPYTIAIETQDGSRKRTR
jgi:mRNA degradation ribonuclease J1/J2